MGLTFLNDTFVTLKRQSQGQREDMGDGRVSQQSRIIILGAGPVGLGAALELARFGVPSIVIEKHPSTSWHPKTRNFCTRTMEVAMGWGRPVYERLRSIDTPDGWKTPIRFMESATGVEYGQIDSQGFAGPGPEVSPALPIMSSQELIEQIMVDAAKASGLVDLRFSTRATKLIEGGEAGATRAVLAVEGPNGEQELIEGAALVAADGAGSLLRQELNVAMEGHKNVQNLVNCYFRADIESQLHGRTGVLLFVENPQATGVLQALDAKGRWLCQIKVDAEDWSPDAFTKERAAAWVRGAVGVPDLAVDILSLGFWQLNATVAEKLVWDRVIFVGDAAHQFPPTGGLGVNTGLLGMHNAMWKLAHCVKGEASWNLLESYNGERRPVAARVTGQSLQNSINVARIQMARKAGAESGLSPDEIVRESHRYGNHLGVEFGAVYAGPAIVSDGTSAPMVDDDYSIYVESASPGVRAPHVLLGSETGTFSTLHLFGPHFTVLASVDGQEWIDQAADAARALGIKIAAYRIGDSGLADIGGFNAKYGLSNDGAVLVRPDGYVAFRSAGAALDGQDLRTVLCGILGRDDAMARHGASEAGQHAVAGGA